MLRRWLRRLRNVVRRRVVEQEIDEEMRLHVALEAEERVRTGASPIEARRGALLGCVALLACYLPARRAGRVQPMVVMRGD